ncbi:MAG: T9SS type A sorting domain-containing protein [Saprospiraceae bacterium]|nr:T9SS type A sorting domain-containing protein [Saprospiraceae bacterium]
MKNLAFSCFFCVLSFSSNLFGQMNWQHTKGPEGGTFHVLTNDSLYAYATDKFHLFRTSDGLSWESLPHGNLWPVAASPEKLAAGQGYGYTDYQTSEAKFVVSNDHGATWIQGTIPPVANPYFSSLAVCSHGIYVPDGSSGFVFRTQDDGLTWDTLVAPSLYAYDSWGFDDQLFVTTWSKVWRLASNGIDWELVSPVFDSGDYLRTMYAADSLLFFATGNNVWSSSDAGTSWTKTPGSNVFETGSFTRVGDRIFKIFGYKRLVYTDDFGHTWKDYPMTEFFNSITHLATAGGKVLAGTGNFGVYRLDENEQKLVPCNDGLHSAWVSELDYGNGYLWSAGSVGVFAYDVAQQTWVDKAKLPLDFYRKITVSPGGKVAVIKSYGREIYVSVDAGGSWDTLRVENVSGQVETIRMAYWIGEKLCVRTDFFDFYWTSDLGQNWEPGPTMFQVAAFNGHYYGINQDSHLEFSTDNGNTWQLAPTPPPAKIRRLFATNDRLFALARDAQWAYHLYSTVDGIHWSYANDGLPQMAWEDEDSFSATYFGGVWQMGDRYYLHGPVGFLFASLDSCKTWLPVDPDVNYCLELHDTTFYAGASNGGVLKATAPEHYGALSSGTVYNDLNNNGLKDPGEPPLSGVRVSMKESGAWFPLWFAHSGFDGSYFIGSTHGSVDTLSVTSYSNYIENIHPPFYIVSGSDSTRHFGIHFTPDITDVSVQGGIAGRPRPGFPVWQLVHYQNEGTVAASGLVSVKLDPHFQLSGTEPAPTAVMGTDSLVWDFGPMAPFEQRSIRIFGNVAASAPLGGTFTLRAHITPASADQAPANNHFSTLDTIVGSYDPNEKRVEPARGLSASEIEAGKELFYTIYFQNTGSFQAERVRITDLLDTALDAGTLRLVAASHEVTGFELLPGNLLEVIFDSILLPDSNSNEPASHGFVTFAIQRHKAFNKDQVVRNRAAIYFDFNEPIITNTVITPIHVPQVVWVDEPFKTDKAPSLLISPNPAVQDFTVFSSGSCVGQGEIAVYNSNGALHHTLQVNDLSLPTTLQANDWPSGIYFVRVKDAHKEVWGKLVLVERH